MTRCAYHHCQHPGGTHQTLGLCPYHYEEARLLLGINHNPKHL